MCFRRQWISGRLGLPPGGRKIAENGKKRRSTGDEGSADAKLACISVDDDVAKKNSKKKGFSWNQYFSEEIGIAAPPRLFRNVRDISCCLLFGIFTHAGCSRTVGSVISCICDLVCVSVCPCCNEKMA